MMLILVGIGIVIVSEVLYILTDIWELQYGYVVGTIFLLIGVIQIGKYFGMFSKKEGKKE